jgi:rRNA small subunit pseudouridine methyltransferase Nep1
MSYDAGKCVRPSDFASTIGLSEPICILVGAMAHGDDKWDWAEEKLSISEYPLSASVVCGKLCCAFEERWGVV